MKRKNCLFIFVIFMPVISFCAANEDFDDFGDLGTEIEQEVKQPVPVCLADILKIIGVSLDQFVDQLGDFKDLANMALASICFSDGQVTTADNIVLIQPKTVVQQLDSLVRIFVQDKKKSFSAGLRYATADPIINYLKKIPLVTKVLDLATISNVVVAISNANDKGPVLGVANIRPGVTIAARLTVNSGNFLYNVLNEISLTDLQIKITIPFGIKSSSEAKFEIIQLQKPIAGICLLKVLNPFLDLIGLKDVAQPVFDLLSLLCFGTDIGMAVDPDTFNMIFYIRGPLKGTAAEGAVKARARTVSDQASFGKYIFTAGMRPMIGKDGKQIPSKLSDLVPGLGYLDNVVVLKDITISATNDKGPKSLAKNEVYSAGLFDIDPETKMVNPQLAGALAVGYGVNISATIDSGSLLNTLLAIKPLQALANNMRLQVNIASKDAIKASIVRADGNPFTLKLTDFPGLNQLSSVPLIGDVTSASLSVNGIDIEKTTQGIQLKVKGTMSVLGVDARVEIRAITGIKESQYAVGIFPSGTVKLSDIDSSLSALSNQLGSMTNVGVILSSADYDNMFDIQRVKKGANIIGDYLAGGLVGDVFNDIGLGQVRVQVNMVKGSTGKMKPVISFIPLQKPVAGICLLKALSPLLDLVGLKDAAQPVFNLLSLLCFGTDIGIAIDPDTFDMIFYIQGPLKGVAAEGAVKARARTANDQASFGKYIFTAGMRPMIGKDGKQIPSKLSDLVPGLGYLDNVVVLKDITISATNDKGPKNLAKNEVYSAGLFDIDPETKMVNPQLAGALAVGYGVNISATIDSGQLLNTLLAIKPLQALANNILLQVNITSKDAIKASIVRADGKPFTLKLTDFPGLSQLPSVPLIGDVTSASLSANSIDIEKTAEGIKLVVPGFMSVLGVSARVEVRATTGAQGPQYAVGIFPGGTVKLSDIDNSLAPMNSLGSLSKLVIVLAGTDYSGDLWGVPSPKRGVTVASDLLTTGFLTNLAKLIGFDTLRIVIRFATVNGRVVPRIELAPPQDQQLCISTIQSLVPEPLKAAFDLPKKIMGKSDICVDRKNIRMVPYDGGVYFAYDGSIGSWDSSIYVNIDKDGSQKGLGLRIQTKGTFDLGLFNDKLKGTIVLNDPLIIVATQPMTGGVWGPMSVMSGFSMQSKVSFGGVIDQVLSMLSLKSEISDIVATITVPSDISRLDDYAVELKKPFGQPKSIAGDLLKISSFSGIFKGGVPPSFGLNLDGLLRIPGSSSDLNITFGTSITGPAFNLSGVAKCAQSTCPAIDLGKFLPISVKATSVTPLSVVVHFSAAGLTGFGGSGVVELLQKNSSAAFDIDAVNILKSGIKAHFDKVCMADIPKLYSVFFGKVTGFDSSLFNKIPDFFCIKDADLSVANDSVKIADVSIEPGLRLSGNFNSDLLPVNGKVNIAVIPPNIQSVLTKPMDIGLQGSISLDPINLGGIIKVTAVDGSSGPIMQVNASAKRQGINGSAKVDIAGIYSQVASLTFDISGFDVASNNQIMGLDASFNARVPFANPTNTSVSYTITQDITDRVKGKLTGFAQALKKEILGQMSGVVSAIKSIVDQIPSALSGLPGARTLKTIVNNANSVINQAGNVLDGALNIGTISIKKVALTASLGDFKKGVFSGTVECTILGQSKTVTLAPFNVTDPEAFIKALAHAILSSLTMPDLSGFANQLNNLKDQAVNVLKELLMNVPLELFNAALDFANNLTNLFSDPKAAIGAVGDVAGQVTGKLSGLASSLGLGDLTSSLGLSGLGDIAGTLGNIGKSVGDLTKYIHLPF